MKALRIGHRLALGFGIVIAFLILLAVLAWTRIASLSGEIHLMVTDRYPKTVLANRIKAEVNESTRSMLNVLVMADEGQIRKELDNIEARNRNIDEALAALDKIIADEQGRALIQSIADIRAKLQPAQAKFVELVHADRKDDAMVRMMFSVRPLQAKYFEQLDAFIRHQDGQMEEAGASSTAAAHATEWLIAGLALGAVVLSMLAGFITARRIVAPMNKAVRVARNVAGGDLSSRIEVRSADETGQMLAALKDMNEALSKIVDEVRNGTDTIAAASHEIAEGNMRLSSLTQEQASALQQTSTSMATLTQTVRQNADNARQANQLVETASTVAGKGGEAMNDVVRTMGSINESSKKIVDIISVIDGIAFQTNILALNAAVEAARAGEQGKGFAVVATEVRSLAQRSAAAAKEIKELIGDSVEKVAQGSELVRSAGATMEELVASVQRVRGIMAEITAASHEQSAGIEEINHAIRQIDRVTQQNAALVEEAAASAESMRQQAAHLAQLVSVFKTGAAVQLRTVIEETPAALPHPAAFAQHVLT